MGRIFTVEFDDSNQDYYMCKLCRTHIVLNEDLNDMHIDVEESRSVFYKAFNLQVDEAAYHREDGGNTVADVYCIKCGDKLGLKYIRVGWRETTLQKENVQLHMNKLLRRYGNHILDAETLEPVP